MVVLHNLGETPSLRFLWNSLYVVELAICLIQLILQPINQAFSPFHRLGVFLYHHCPCAIAIQALCNTNVF